MIPNKRKVDLSATEEDYQWLGRNILPIGRMAANNTDLANRVASAMQSKLDDTLFDNPLIPAVPRTGTVELPFTCSGQFLDPFLLRFSAQPAHFNHTCFIYKVVKPNFGSRIPGFGTLTGFLWADQMKTPVKRNTRGAPNMMDDAGTPPSPPGTRGSPKRKRG